MHCPSCAFDIDLEVEGISTSDTRAVIDCPNCQTLLIMLDERLQEYHCDASVIEIMDETDEERVSLNSEVVTLADIVGIPFISDTFAVVCEDCEIEFQASTEDVSNDNVICTNCFKHVPQDESLEDAENKINDEEFFNTLNFKEYIGGNRCQH